MTNSHRLVGLDNKHLFLSILEAVNSKTQWLVRTYFLVHRWLFPHCVLTWYKGWGSSLGFLLKGH